MYKYSVELQQYIHCALRSAVASEVTYTSGICSLHGRRENKNHKDAFVVVVAAETLGELGLETSFLDTADDSIRAPASYHPSCVPTDGCSAVACPVNPTSGTAVRLELRMPMAVLKMQGLDGLTDGGVRVR